MKNKRTLITDLDKSLGKQILISGYVHRVRDLGGICFAIIRDRTGFVQIATPNKDLKDNLKKENIVNLKGVVKEDSRAPGGLEVKVDSIELLATAGDLPIELNVKPKETLEKLLEYRPLSLRNPYVADAFRIKSIAVNAFRKYVIGEDFIEIHTPKIVATGTEGGTRLFGVKYFKKDAFLAQSPQLYKQIMVGALERVFEVGPAFRAEPHDTPRHLNEYTSLDVELGFIGDENELLELNSQIIRHMFYEINKSYGDALEERGIMLEFPANIPVIRFSEAQEILAEHHGKEAIGREFDSEREKLLCDYAKRKFGTDFLFVTHFPKKSRPFYTMPDEDCVSTKSFDLLYKGLEITSGSQRIHSYTQLIDNMKLSGLNPENYVGYLSAFKYGLPPHGGFAIGLERLVIKMLNLENVREASLFPRDMKRLEP